VNVRIEPLPKLEQQEGVSRAGNVEMDRVDDRTGITRASLLPK
jgi:hypothetical protein